MDRPSVCSLCSRLWLAGDKLQDTKHSTLDLKNIPTHKYTGGEEKINISWNTHSDTQMCTQNCNYTNIFACTHTVCTHSPNLNGRQINKHKQACFGKRRHTHMQTNGNDRPDWSNYLKPLVIQDVYCETKGWLYKVFAVLAQQKSLFFSA